MNLWLLSHRRFIGQKVKRGLNYGGNRQHCSPANRQYVWVIAPGYLWERKAFLRPALSHTMDQPGGTIQACYKHTCVENNITSLFLCLFEWPHTIRAPQKDLVWHGFTSFSHLSKLSHNERSLVFLKSEGPKGLAWSRVAVEWKNWWIKQLGAINNVHKQILIGKNN